MKTERQYLADIKKRCEMLGTWRDEFDATRRRLAKIYARLDAVEDQYIREGEEVLVEKEGSQGQVNRVVNPLLTEIEKLSDQALTHEKELGLTAAALKKINEDALHAKAASPLAGLEKLLGEKKVVKMA